MEHIIAKTGLGLAINQAIYDLQLEKDRNSIKAMLLDVFTRKFDAFKKAHANRFQTPALRATYLVEN